MTMFELLTGIFSYPPVIIKFLLTVDEDDDLIARVWSNEKVSCQL
jgi:hypothetical protein